MGMRDLSFNLQQTPGTEAPKAYRQLACAPIPQRVNISNLHTPIPSLPNTSKSETVLL